VENPDSHKFVVAKGTRINRSFQRCRNCGCRCASAIPKVFICQNFRQNLKIWAKKFWHFNNINV